MKSKKLLTVLGCFVLVAIPILTLHAAKNVTNEEWELHTSETGIFKVRFPKSYRYKTYPLRLGDKEIAHAQELIAVTESELMEDQKKTYLIKLDQTFGNPLKTFEIKEMLEEETNKYKLTSKALGGTLISSKDIEHFKFIGKEFYLTYSDKVSKKKKKEKMAMRVRVIYTDTAKIQMVLDGPSASMYSFRSNDFFESIRPVDGYLQKPGKLEQGWKKFSDPHSIFSIVIPPRHPDYRPDKPKYKAGQRTSSTQVVFTDNIVSQKIFYNAYSYRLDQPANAKIAKKILFSRHVSKYAGAANEDSLQVDSSTEGKVGIIKTQLVIQSQKAMPYLNSILMQVTFKDNFVVVQEVAGSAGHALGKFGKALTATMKFHPQNFKLYDPANFKPKRKEAEKQKESASGDVQKGKKTPEPKDDAPKTPEKKSPPEKNAASDDDAAIPDIDAGEDVPAPEEDGAAEPPAQ